MLRLSIEELSALNLILKECSLQEFLSAAMYGFVDCKENVSIEEQEKSDLCYKLIQTLRE